MEGSEVELGSSVNFAVCTRDVPPATNNISTDWQKRYHRPAVSRNVDYSPLMNHALRSARHRSRPDIEIVILSGACRGLVARGAVEGPAVCSHYRDFSMPFVYRFTPALAFHLSTPAASTKHPPPLRDTSPTPVPPHQTP